MLCTTGTKTIRSTATTQTASISHLPTVKILDHYTAPLTNESRHKVQSTKDFIDKNGTNTWRPQTSVFWCEITVHQYSTSTGPGLHRDSHHKLDSRTTATQRGLMDLLKLCLTCSFFQYNGKHYKQLHGTAMGSPVSGVVAEIVMQNIEQQALATYKETLPLWLTLTTHTAVHKDEIDFLRSVDEAWG